MLSEIVMNLIRHLGIPILPLSTIERNLRPMEQKGLLEIRSIKVRQHRSLSVVFTGLEEKRRILARANGEDYDPGYPYYKLMIFDDGSWMTKVASLDEIPYWPRIIDALYGDHLLEIYRMEDTRYRNLYMPPPSYSHESDDGKEKN